MLKLVDVSKYYTANGTVALGLRKATMELHLNEFVAVVGESGSGKTTLLNVISGIDTYEEGEMYLNGEETSYYSAAEWEEYRKRYIAFVFQNYNLVDSFTVLQNVELPLILSGVPAKEAKKRALAIIQRVGMEKHIHHKATRLSGGQKQRVVIARALAKDCPIIAADEPTGNLDSVSARQIIELLYEISKDKLVIMVTHDYDQVKEFATRKIRIYDGEIVEDLEVVKTEKSDLPVMPEETPKINLKEQFRLALRSLFSVPKKSILMILVFFIFAFLVVMVYGATKISMSGSYYFPSREFFSNNSVSRIVVRKQDRSIFEAADIAELEALSHVKTLISQDYLLDMPFYLRSVLPVAEFDNQMLYLESTQLLPYRIIDSESLLFAGKLPEAENDVLLVMPAADIDSEEEQTLYLDRDYQIEYSDFSGLADSETYRVSGLVRANDIYMSDDTYLIVSDDRFQELTNQVYPNLMTNAKYDLDSDALDSANRYYYDDWLNESIQYYSSLYPIILDPTLAEDVILLNPDRQYYFCEESEACGTYPGELVFQDVYKTTIISNLELGIAIAPGDYVLKVSPEVYDQIFYDEVYQVTVFADSDINVDRLVSRIATIQSGGESKYKTAYPFGIEPVDQINQAIRFFETIAMVATLIVTILGATFISYLIFRAIINTKLRDYAIYRTVGANQSIIRKEIHLENYLIVSFSYALFVILLLMFRFFVEVDQYNLFYALKQFEWLDYLIFYGILVLMSLLISSRYCGRIFGSTVQTALKTE
ncbi:MAG: ABC transporter ATP-binding protein [Candidatus Izemoplasmatales bacterium]|nr:ABC transporter ATP-binding protein [Candidatus Izemoplasmatales bacterium]